MPCKADSCDRKWANCYKVAESGVWGENLIELFPEK